MLHVLDLSVSVYRKSDKKSKLHFDAFQRFNFIPCNIVEAAFRFLEKPQDVLVAFRHHHFPHAKPFIELVSLYFKIKPSVWPDGLPQPLLLLVRNFTLKHFKNVSKNSQRPLLSIVTAHFFK